MNKLSFTILFLISSITFAQSPLPPGVQLEKIATGFKFVEGPLWKARTGLFFSDLNGNVLYKWNETNGAVPFLNPSLNSNGLTFDLQGRMLITQTGQRRVVRLESDDTQTILASSYKGKKLNSPNDIVVKSDGGIFFTDPPFNIPTGQHQELPYSGIFRISTYGGLQLLDSTLSYPNGICFSPDQKKLFVNDSQKRIIYVWDVVNDSTIANKRTFASIAPAGYADGMKTDSAGNIFCAGPLGIWVFSPGGTLLDTIIVPETPSNCNWGDDGRTLYITAQTSIYRIRLVETTGVNLHDFFQDENKNSDVKSLTLYKNYPNPFNPVTTISYSLPNDSFVSLKIYNLTGKEIITLINKEMHAGNYSVTWNVGNNPSGVYLCKVTAGDFTKVGKMMLLK